MKNALLLAAGFSTRLRPLTNEIPKILLPFLHMRVLDFQLAYLKSLGARSIHINAHHGLDAMNRAIADLKDAAVILHEETPDILLSGGGIFNMISAVDTQDLTLCMNSDAFVDADIAALTKLLDGTNAVAAMHLVDPEIVSSAETYQTVGINLQNEVVKLRTLQTEAPNSCGIFTGLQMLTPAYFTQHIPQKAFDLITELYIPKLMPEKKLTALVERQRWIDLGDLRHYISAQIEFLLWQPKWMQPLLKSFLQPHANVWIHPSSYVDKKAMLQGPLLIGPDCSIQGRSKLGPNVVCSGSNVIKNSNIQNSALYPNACPSDHSECINSVIVHSTQSIPLT